MRRAALLIAVILFAPTLGVRAWEFTWEGELGVDAVAMSWVNDQIDAYEVALHELVIPIGFGLSMAMRSVVTDLQLAGFSPVIAVEARIASRDTGGGPFRATALGVAVGGRRDWGHFTLGVDVGGYWGSLRQPRSANLSGWGVGAGASARISIPLGERLHACVGLSATLLSIGRAPGSSEERDGGGGDRLLDFSGVGLSLGTSWKGW